VPEVHAGRIEAMRLLEVSVEVTWRPRGSPRSRARLVDRVVNGTGPDMRVTRNPDPLVQSLLAGGLVRADAQGLGRGIEVAADGRGISRDGAPVDSHCCIGPGLRTRDWEATAVPELRELAARLARAGRKPVKRGRRALFSRVHGDNRGDAASRGANC
jgi:uncharacterized NAD(P)/FAD-binding protein YdhS